MLITKAQAALLKLLGNLECMQLPHAKAYLQQSHSMSDYQADGAIKQLSIKGKIMLTEGFIMLPHRRPNDKLLCAADVMMSLTGGKLHDVWRDNDLFTLIYSIRDDTLNDRFFGIIIVESGTELSIASRVQKKEGLTMIYVLEDTQQQRQMQISGKHYFALRDAEAGFKFFKNNGGAKCPERK